MGGEPAHIAPLRHAELRISYGEGLANQDSRERGMTGNAGAIELAYIKFS
jgi:hypothetical protein